MPAATDADYGVDIAMIVGPDGSLDLDPYFTLVSGAKLVAQDLARRLTSPRGSMFWAPGIGRDVRGMLNESIDAPTLRAFSAALATEIRADERVDPDSLSVRVGFTSATSTMTVSITGSTTLGGPFTLVLAVTAVTVSILDLSAAQ